MTKKNLGVRVFLSKFKSRKSKGKGGYIKKIPLFGCFGSPLQLLRSWLHHAESLVLMHELSSCGALAQDIPRAGLVVLWHVGSEFPCSCCCWVTSVVSDSVWPQRRQPTRLPCPWDSPGNNTGVDCHFLLQCRKVKSESEIAQLCLTLRDPMDCSLPGSSVHGTFPARVLEWGAIAFSVSSPTRDQTHAYCISR